MNGHGQGVLLLQDLEDEDLEYETNYSTGPTTTYNYPTSTSNTNGTNGDSDKKKFSNGTTSQNTLKVNSLKPDRTSHPMIKHSNGRTSYHRRKSISAEPPGLDYDFNIKSHTSHTLQVDDLDYQNSNGYHTNSSMSMPYINNVNNAITVAPSRNSLLEPNVFAGGRIHQNNHHHHKKHHHRKHKGRSKSPMSRLSNAEHVNVNPGSILSKIDNSIMKNFGDWSNMDDEGNLKNNLSDNFRSNNNPSNNSNKPYYIPKKNSNQDEEVGFNGQLPKLFKGYDTVVKNAKQVLTDKSYLVALSKDNNDPNSILSEAKRTLNQFGAHLS